MVGHPLRFRSRQDLFGQSHRAWRGPDQDRGLHDHAVRGRGIAPGAEVIAARIALVALVSAAAEAAFADPTGVWREKDGGTMCGTIATVQPRLDSATGKPRTDKNNENASKRKRPLAGIQVLIAMRPN